MRDARRAERFQLLLDLRQVARDLAQRLTDALVAEVLALAQIAQGLRELAGDRGLELEQLLLHAIEPARQLEETRFGFGRHGESRRYYRKSREDVGNAGSRADRTECARTDTPSRSCSTPSTSSTASPTSTS